MINFLFGHEVRLVIEQKKKRVSEASLWHSWYPGTHDRVTKHFAMLQRCPTGLVPQSPWRPLYIKRSQTLKIPGCLLKPYFTDSLYYAAALSLHTDPVIHLWEI